VGRRETCQSADAAERRSSLRAARTRRIFARRPASGAASTLLPVSTGMPRSVLRKLGYAPIGVALGGIGLGWHGRQTDAVIVSAIRGRSPENSLATIALVDVTRNWVQEIFGTSDSEFLVTARVTPRDGPSAERCYAIEPGLADTAPALDPYAAWRCAYPF
jgi:hypothetical protein